MKTGRKRFLTQMSKKDVRGQHVCAADSKKLSPDSGRSRKIIEGVFPCFGEVRFFRLFQIAKTLKMLEYALEVLKLPEGAL